MTVREYLGILSFAFLVFFSCKDCDKLANAGNKDKELKKNIENSSNKSFDDYWYQSKAEVSTYYLEQARYGELREGEAVLIFVTEDFLINSQVKKETAVDEEHTSVLKLNFLRKFPTGVYDYSMMTSTFSPVHQSKLNSPLKSSTSSQDWCGHSWMQLNKKPKGFSLSSFSYFQQEGDQKKFIGEIILEDGLWSQIRMSPELLPIGEHQVFPGAHYLRFSHQEAKAYKASISLDKGDAVSKDSSNINVLHINYPELNRSLKISFQAEFPHEITGWEETRKSGFGAKAKMLTTKAIKKAQMLSPYWNQHGTDDAYLREVLSKKQISP